MFVLVRRGVKTTLAMTGAALMALSAGGCSGMGDTLKSDAGWFSKPITSVFSREDGSGSMASSKSLSLGPSGPVAPEDLINPDGSCAAAAPATPAPASPAAPAQQSDRPVGSMAGDLAGAPMPAGAPASGDEPVLGGIALGMSECQAVRRAGTPSNVAISMAENNERKVVLTYLAGEWPGIYTFMSGRLKVVDAAPAPPKPKPTPKKKAPPKRAPTRIN